MKKLIYLCLAVTMTAFLFGCGEENTTKDSSNNSGDTPACKNGVVCPEEQPKTDKGQTKEFKLTFTNTTGKGNKVNAFIYMPDANMFKFNPNKGKCSVTTLGGSKVHIERYDDHNETPICDVYYTFTAPKDGNTNTDLTIQYILFTGSEVPAPTDEFTVKHPLTIDTSNNSGNTPACKNGVVCPEEQPKTDKGQTKEFKLTFTNTTGKGNKVNAFIYMPDANMFKFNPNKGKCSVTTLGGSKVHIERYDDHNETPICDVYYTFTAPKDGNTNTDLTGEYILFTGSQVPAPTDGFTVKHPVQ